MIGEWFRQSLKRGELVLISIIGFLYLSCTSASNGPINPYDPNQNLTLEIKAERNGIEVGESTEIIVSLVNDSLEAIDDMLLDLYVSPESENLGSLSQTRVQTDQYMPGGISPEVFFQSRALGSATIFAVRLGAYEARMDSAATVITILESAYNLNFALSQTTFPHYYQSMIFCRMWYGDQDSEIFQVGGKRVRFSAYLLADPLSPFGEFTPSSIATTSEVDYDGLQGEYYFFSSVPGVGVVVVQYDNQLGTTVLVDTVNVNVM